MLTKFKNLCSLGWNVIRQLASFLFSMVFKVGSLVLRHVSKFIKIFSRHYRWLLAKDEVSAFPAGCSDTAHGVPASKIDPKDGSATILQRFFFTGNWKVESRELPRFQVQGEGRILEPFVTALIGAVGQKKPNARVGWSWDADTREGALRTLRVVDRVEPGHLVTTDVSVYQRDGDLFIGMSGKAWSKTRFWTRSVGSLVVAGLFLLIMAWVVNQPGFRKSWVRDFAKKHAATGTVTRPGGSPHAPSYSFTEVEPLEAFIEYGSRPSGDQLITYLYGLMLKAPDHTEDFESILHDYLGAYRERAISFSNSDYEHALKDLVYSSYKFRRYGNWRGVNRLDVGLVYPGRRESECAVT